MPKFSRPLALIAAALAVFLCLLPAAFAYNYSSTQQAIAVEILPSAPAGQFLQSNGTTYVPAQAVTSLGLIGDGIVFNQVVPGSPVTTTGTLPLNLKTQAPNTFLAGPVGGTGTPNFRNLMISDFNGGANASAASFWRGDGTWATVAQGGGGIAGLTGDVTTAIGTGTVTATLNTVNATTGSFGSANQVPVLTVNGKGLVTQVTQAVITPAAIGAPTLTGTGASGSWGISISGSAASVTTIGTAQVTNANLAGGIAAAKLIGTDIATVGTLTTGTWNASPINLSLYAGGTLQAAQEPAHTGDVTNAAGSLTLTIGTGRVTNADLAGAIAASKLTGTDIATLGTITTGTWNAAPIGTAYLPVGINGPVIGLLNGNNSYSGSNSFTSPLTVAGLINSTTETANAIGIGTTAPAVSLDASAKTDGLALPVGTTGQRPVAPPSGTLRYNATLGMVEAYISGAWASLGSVPPQVTQVTTGLTDTVSSLTVNRTTRAWTSPTVGARTESIPACAAALAGKDLAIVDETGSGATYTINPASGTVNGFASFSFNAPAGSTTTPTASLTIECDGVSNWMVM